MASNRPGARPAILGGEPVTHASNWPPWPRWDDCEQAALREVLASGRWQSGPQVAELEREFAAYQGCGHAVCVTNGTSSLELALRSLSIGPGDEVIMPTYTFAATALAALAVGARPVLVDSQPETLNLDPDGVRAALTANTRAVMPVHVAGHPVELDALLALSREKDLPIIEDAAHAHGAEWRGERVGGQGYCASFSFQTGKSVTAGDGGCLTTDDAGTAELLRSLRDFGRGQGGEPVRVGGNQRMTEFQAAVLRCQLARLDEQIAVRESRVSRLEAQLAEVPGIRLAARDPRVTRHPNYQVLLHYRPDDFGLSKTMLLAALAAEGLPLEAGYRPLHQMALFKQAQAEGRVIVHDCPVAEAAWAETTVWLSFRLALADEGQLDTLLQALEKLHGNAGELADSEVAT